MQNYTALFPFEFCALRFLIQWQGRERELYEAIKTNPPTGSSIHKALSYFQVARNFKGLKQPKKLTSIQDSLLNIRADQKTSDEKKVERLASEFQVNFAQFNLSAASKLLWLSQREPFIIYDKRAVVALTQKLGQRFQIRNYSEYCRIWREQYSIVEPAIRLAADQLPNGRMFMPKWSISDIELLRMAKETWFMERVFDIFLWEIGGNG